MASSALALLPNHDYNVTMSTLSETNHQTLVEKVAAKSDTYGKLSFHFSNIPDSSTAPFLLVEIIDMASVQPNVVRQNLIPAPEAGQALRMGMNEISHRQTQAALRAMDLEAMQGTPSTGDAALRAMFPMTMIATGAMSDTDADNFGIAANDAATAFATYLSNNGVTSSQMAIFQNELLVAMRAYAADNMAAVDDTSSSSAAGIFGRADAQLMTAMMLAGSTAGIDPILLEAAFDQAGQAMNSSTALNGIPAGMITAMQATFMAGTQQGQMISQMSSYAAAMPVVGASAGQTQILDDATTVLQAEMFAARESFCQQAFADPATLSSQADIDQALSDMQTAMQTAFGKFNDSTIATDDEIGSMLGVMAQRMNGMSGSTLSGFGLGMMQTEVGGNWSTMMVAATNLLDSIPEMSYASDTTDLNLMAQLTNLEPLSMPVALDLSGFPVADSPDKSLAQLQYDLMLVHLIDVQMAINLAPLDPTDMADISAADLANRTMILQGMTGLTEVQKSALLSAMSPMHLI
jgi:hypothetical protein